MELQKKGLRKLIVDLLIIALGMAIYALGFCVFILPHHIVIGGMAGFSTLVYCATGGLIPVAVTMYAANALLLVFGFKSLGKWFVLNTIYGMTLISVMIGALEGYFTSHPPLVQNVPMSVAIGSVLLGLAVGIYYSHHGTGGGTDIVAAIMTQKTKLSMGRVMMIVDISIVALSFFLPFNGNMEARIQARTEDIIYGWMAILIYSTLADRYINQGRQTMQLIILSSKWREIAEFITHEIGRGVTTWKTTGYWTQQERTMMLIWCRKYDIGRILRGVHEIDPRAFMTSSTVRGIEGNGFSFTTPMDDAIPECTENKQFIEHLQQEQSKETSTNEAQSSKGEHFHSHKK